MGCPNLLPVLLVTVLLICLMYKRSKKPFYLPSAGILTTTNLNDSTNESLHKEHSKKPSSLFVANSKRNPSLCNQWQAINTNGERFDSVRY